MDENNYILVTGSAGFIGFHFAKLLLENGYKVVGLDNVNGYYDIKIKEARLNILEQYDKFIFVRADLKDKADIDKLFEKYKPSYVVHLAAQAGVRYSIENPYSYVDSNLVGFVNILEACRNNPVKHLIYASSSSVYGGNKAAPFSTNHNVDHPVSLYAATKKSNELLAHAYSHLYNIPTTGIRFFTVYGPWGRPDMAYFLFTKAIVAGEQISVFNHGNMERDFTYIDDIVDGMYRLIDKAPTENKDWDESDGNISESHAPYKIYNIGNSKPVKLTRFIKVLEDALGVKAEKNFMDMQAGDVLRTFADVTDLQKTIGFAPGTSIEEGLAKFVKWYREYYG